MRLTIFGLAALIFWIAFIGAIVATVDAARMRLWKFAAVMLVGAILFGAAAVGMMDCGLGQCIDSAR